MDYSKRLLKFLKMYNGVFTIAEVASIWKRNVTDVHFSVVNLVNLKKIKVQKDGVLTLKDGIGGA